METNVNSSIFPNNLLFPSIKVGIYKVDNRAIPPNFARLGDACADICCIDNVILKPGIIEKVRTGFAIILPHGYEAQIRSRSSIPLEHNVIIANGIGTIDEHYIGEVMVLMLNINRGEDSSDVVFSPGDKIAQIAIRKVENVRFYECDSEVYEIARASSRGGGLGSTGLSSKEIAEERNKPEILQVDARDDPEDWIDQF